MGGGGGGSGGRDRSGPLVVLVGRGVVVPVGLVR